MPFSTQQYDYSLKMEKSLWEKYHSFAIPTIQMSPFPHTEAQVIKRIDRELSLLKGLSLKRRSCTPCRDKVRIRQGPIPTILAQGYKPKPHFIKEQGTVLLPPPSLVNPIQVHKPVRRSNHLPNIQKAPEQPSETLLHPTKILAHRYDSSLTREVEHLLIQKPVVIYMKNQVPK